MSLNWKIMDQTMPTIFHVSRSKLLGKPVTRINKNFAENVLLAREQMYFFDDKL